LRNGRNGKKAQVGGNQKTQKRKGLNEPGGKFGETGDNSSWGEAGRENTRKRQKRKWKLIQGK